MCERRRRLIRAPSILLPLFVRSQTVQRNEFLSLSLRLIGRYQIWFLGAVSAQQLKRNWTHAHKQRGWGETFCFPARGVGKSEKNQLNLHTRRELSYLRALDLVASTREQSPGGCLAQTFCSDAARISWKKAFLAFVNMLISQCANQPRCTSISGWIEFCVCDCLWFARSLLTDSSQSESSWMVRVGRATKSTNRPRHSKAISKSVHSISDKIKT